MKGVDSTLFVVVKFTRSLGASEDLVVAAAVEISRTRPAPAFWFNFRPLESDWRIQALRAAGCRIHFHDAGSRSLRFRSRVFHSAGRKALESSLASAIRDEMPSRVVLNQGGNSDASVEAPVLQSLGLPYAVLCHAATEFSWPDTGFLPAMRSIFLGADRCFFVSDTIRELTEAQLGIVLDNAQVVYNPCKFQDVQRTQWPKESSRFSLAAVARLENKQKGHDLILRVLALPQWRCRPLSVTFYGKGPHREPLESYAAALGLHSVHFAGHVNDIRAIWSKHQGFIQASRSEGYGLSLLEAMFCERMAVTTAIPSATEFVTEGETGFVARAASVEELSDALERAWAARDSWRGMGLAAARRVATGYPEQPVTDFVTLIQKIG